jgi:hypothetical protein
VPTGNPLRDRTVLHLAYLDEQARFELITRFLPRLESTSPRRRWFFVDVPIDTRSGLEVVQLHARTDRSVKADLVVWMNACRSARLITAATFADQAMVLDPGLFLDQRVPVFYPLAMADGSARAASVLGRLGRSASEPEVAGEIAALFTALVPTQITRRFALELYATWLDWAAAPTANVAARPDRMTIRASLIARLAHTQAVRLFGPDYSGELRREAEMVRSLLRQATTTSSSARGTGT